MSATHHAARRESPLARLTRLARKQPPAPVTAAEARRDAERMRDPRMPMPAGMPFADTRTWVPERPHPEVHHEPPAGPVHMVADEYSIMPCCGQHETQVPRTDFVTANPRLVTCRTAGERRDSQQHITTITMPVVPVVPSGVPAECPPPCLLDARAPDADLLRRILDGLRALDVSERPAADLCADLADLPVFREALGQRTRCRAGECLCGHLVTGDTWGERMVRVGIHLLAGAA